MRILLQIALCLAVAGAPALAQRGGGGHGGGMGGGGFHGGMGGGGFHGGMGMGGRGGMGMGRGFRGGGFNNGFNKGFGFNRNFFFRRNFNRAFSSIFFNGAFVPGFGGFGGFWPSYGLGYDYGYPYGGDYGYPYGADYGYPDMAAAPVQTSPNVTVIYPPSQPANTALYVQPARPVMREYDQYGQEIAPSYPSSANTADAARAAPSGGSPVYLFAFKDNVIRAAAAYWVDGHVLHYVTTDHEERQVPLSDVDRTLTQRLNSERHVAVQLP